MIRHLTAADYRVMPWANGRGTTTELARVDREGGGLSWRLSVATVSEDGPFSPLPGIDRILTLLDGDGFDLMIEGNRHALAPLSPIAFSGDTAVSAVNVKGPSRDFNVMVDRREWEAEVRHIQVPPTADPADGKAFLYLLADSELSGDSGNLAACIGDLIEFEREMITLTKGAALLVRIHPRGERDSPTDI